MLKPKVTAIFKMIENSCKLIPHGYSSNANPILSHILRFSSIASTSRRCKRTEGENAASNDHYASILSHRDLFLTIMVLGDITLSNLTIFESIMVENLETLRLKVTSIIIYPCWAMTCDLSLTGICFGFHWINYSSDRVCRAALSSSYLKLF